ncbi:hypothetical protein N0B51_05880 [Tsuneonella sp. YG55]|uniref:Uncharacterized protein n=1 Tax=Tsuneonella litorea TaxID=2976475 RepID=A0A9X2W215_9SPHN|nr:hypothetical protein [Tsuneonella litorea]MCT2558505.1 hypothetical protein [Tsuneonella litorea]
MERRGDQIVETETEASAGSKEGVVRWVLIIGTLLAIGFLTIIWVTGAATQGDVEEEATVSGIIESQADAPADVILSDDVDAVTDAPVEPVEPAAQADVRTDGQ